MLTGTRFALRCPMPLSSIPSAGVRGIEAYPVDVEVDIRHGLPSWTTVGLPEGAVKESRDRVVAAIHNSGYAFERQRVTINLSPAAVRKQGTAFDLPIALGLMASSEMISLPLASDTLFLGELCLDGRINPVPGILPIAMMAHHQGKRHLVLPAANAREASCVAGLKISPVRQLSEVVDAITGQSDYPLYKGAPHESQAPSPNKLDYQDIKGQLQARRALEIAVAGGHNALLIGPPGSGKTMLTERLPTILPPMTLAEALQTTKIYSVVGRINPEQPLIRQRPFRAPHHSISTAGLIGGGSHPRPGEVSLAHNGVLFLDEFPEFPRHVIELLRQPLESRRITIARALSTLTFPANIMLITAMNPCKCGFLGHPQRVCRCTVYDQVRYRNKISGPIMDRIDIHIEVAPLNYEELSGKAPGEASEAIRTRVMAARQRQHERFTARGAACNARMSVRHLHRHCRLESKERQLMKKAVEELGLSARAYDRILRVSRTIADLAGKERIEASHIAEAIQYRTLDREPVA